MGGWQMTAANVWLHSPPFPFLKIAPYLVFSVRRKTPDVQIAAAKNLQFGADTRNQNILFPQ